MNPLQTPRGWRRRIALTSAISVSVMTMGAALASPAFAMQDSDSTGPSPSPVVISPQTGAFSVKDGNVSITSTESGKVELDSTGHIHVALVISQVEMTGKGTVHLEDPSPKPLNNMNGFDHLKWKQTGEENGHATGVVIWDGKVDGVKKLRWVGPMDNARLPFSLHVDYTLDGKAISPEDLSGKSGKVSAKYTYINTTQREVPLTYSDAYGNVIHKTEPIYLPLIGVFLLTLPTSYHNLTYVAFDSGGDGFNSTLLAGTVVQIPPLGPPHSEFVWTADTDSAWIPTSQIQYTVTIPEQNPSFAPLGHALESGADLVGSLAPVVGGLAPTTANISAALDELGKTLAALGAEKAGAPPPAPDSLLAQLAALKTQAQEVESHSGDVTALIDALEGLNRFLGSETSPAPCNIYASIGALLQGTYADLDPSVQCTLEDIIKTAQDDTGTLVSVATAAYASQIATGDPALTSQFADALANGEAPACSSAVGLWYAIFKPLGNGTAISTAQIVAVLEALKTQTPPAQDLIINQVIAAVQAAGATISVAQLVNILVSKGLLPPGVTGILTGVGNAAPSLQLALFWAPFLSQGGANWFYGSPTSECRSQVNDIWFGGGLPTTPEEKAIIETAGLAKSANLGATAAFALSQLGLKVLQGAISLASALLVNLLNTDGTVEKLTKILQAVNAKVANLITTASASFTHLSASVGALGPKATSAAAEINTGAIALSEQAAIFQAYTLLGKSLAQPYGTPAGVYGTTAYQVDILGTGGPLDTERNDALITLGVILMIGAGIGATIIRGRQT